MASKSKKNTAAITTYGDHEVIRPENKLRSAATDSPSAPGEDDPVARAERALAELSSEFGNWM
ncbi:MAG: Hpt domain-containing protein, partial [Pseudolabrys sp.]